MEVKASSNESPWVPTSYPSISASTSRMMSSCVFCRYSYASGLVSAIFVLFWMSVNTNATSSTSTMSIFL